MKRFTVYMLFFGLTFTIFSCNYGDEKDSSLKQINIIKENYTDKNLLLIQTIGNENETTCSWKISIDNLEKQNKQNLAKLLNNLNFNKCVKIANTFIEEAYSGEYKGKYFFKSMEYEVVNDNRFGDSLSIDRNDWILIFNYSKLNDDYNNVREKVFMLPNGAVIISSNNFENM